jgi:hypothetical protein
MESPSQMTGLLAAETNSKAKTIVYWIVTGLFCLQISFTAYAQLSLPQVAAAFTHLGFPAYFRVDLSWAKLLGVVLLLVPVPAQGVGLCRLRHHPGLCAHRSPLGGRRRGSLELARGDRSAQSLGKEGLQCCTALCGNRRAGSGYTNIYTGQRR